MWWLMVITCIALVVRFGLMATQELALKTSSLTWLLEIGQPFLTAAVQSGNALPPVEIIRGVTRRTRSIDRLETRAVPGALP